MNRTFRQACNRLRYCVSQAAGNTSSGRMQLLAGANAAMNLKQAADAVKAGQGDAQLAPVCRKMTPQA